MTDINSILGTVNSVLGTLNTVASIPGIDMIPYVSTAKAGLAALTAAVQAGQNIAPYVTAIVGTFRNDGSTPTQAELDALDAKIAELEAQVDAPLAPREPGEPD